MRAVRARAVFRGELTLWLYTAIHWAMRTKIQKWGNSQGLRIPKSVLDAAGFTVGQEVEIQPGSRRILLKISAAPKRNRLRIDDLLAKMPKDVKSLRETWEKPSGKEVW